MKAWSSSFPVWWLFLAATPALAAPRPEYGKIELLRDTWGIPHVFSDTDAGALYGLGYATADERGFQMVYNLRIIQGRLAEIVGPRQRAGRRETSLDNDRKMRTFGWARGAVRVAGNLDADTTALLNAYCEGVNDSFAAQQAAGTLHPLFAQLGVKPEPWTAADCLLSWWHLGQFFATDGTRDLLAWRNHVNPPPDQPQRPRPTPFWRDDAASVVQRDMVSDQWVRKVEDHAKALGLRVGRGENPEGPKFSHAWVVGGGKTTTGSAVLVSDPQTPVRNPSLWQEFHICGKTFNARGIGVPGSPGLLIGFTPHIAWGLTALGADQADLFRLHTDAAHENQYRWDGQWRKMDVRTERISVKGADEVPLQIRESHLGPIINDFAFRAPGDPDVALKRIPICETNRETIQSLFTMLRAKNGSEFAAAVAGWRFPSAHCVYGDSAGNIGYTIVGAIPLRAPTAPDPDGNLALPGQADAHDWLGHIPADLLPQVFNPKHGYLFSANHRPIGSFYPLPLGISTGSMGDTIRSWRLRERLSAKQKFTPDNVLAIHDDSVNPARREIVRVGLHIRDSGQEGLSDDALKALRTLEPWLKAGASSDLAANGADTAARIGTFFRMMATPLAMKYGGGESGLARFLKDASSRIAADPKAHFDQDERRFIDTVLAGAAQAIDPARGRAAPPAGTLGWFDSLDGFGSLNPRHDLPSAPITNFDGQTLHCQSAQSYTQWVPLHDVDSARTICPVGHSDRLDSPARTSTMDLWGKAQLHPAPLTRPSVEKLKRSSHTLSN